MTRGTPSRREFLLAAAAAAGAGVPRGNAVTVEAQPTIFRAHPDGRAMLVRFVATGTDQPAGRLRVFDPRGALLGTAGMLRIGDRLLGELWLPVDGETRLRSHLEMPGTRQPIRSVHVIRPMPRWTLHWITFADPAALRAHLLALDPIVRAARAAALVRAGVYADPVGGRPDPFLLDHVGLLRLPVPAVRAEQALAIPVAPWARAAAAADIPNAERVLAGAGVSGIVAADVSPDALGFGRGRREMARRIEGWLAERRAPPATAVIVGVAFEASPAMLAAVDEWNAAYAYPRIVIGAARVELTARRASREWEAAPRAQETADLAALRDARRALAATRHDQTFGPFARLVSAGDTGLEGIARGAALPFSGVLVFNAAPYSRSGPTTRGGYAANVPSLGYAWLPEASAADGDVRRRDGSTVIANGLVRVELDPADGRIRSLRGAEGREWAGAAGLNALAHAELDTPFLEDVPGGRKLVARRVTFRGSITTEITLYQGSDQVAIRNMASVVGTDPVTYVFRAPWKPDTVRWEVPGGARAASPDPGAELPLAALSRWVALDAGAGSLMLALPDTPHAVVDAEGTLTVFAPDGAVRIHLATSAVPSDTVPWRLAADVEPLHAVPAPGTGPYRVPTFGRLVAVDQPGVLVAGLKPADDGVGVIVYLQEILGLPQLAPLRGEVLRFTAALRCDYAERDRGTLELADDALVMVPIERHGFTAVRLLGVGLGG